MKRERWLWVIGLLAVLGLLFLYLRYQKPEFEMNSEIPYQSIQYYFPHPLTSSTTQSGWVGTVLRSDDKAFQIVRSTEELDSILSRIIRLVEQTSTADFTFDDSFFENNALLLVEVCENPSVTTVARPEDLEEKNGKVTLTVEWGSDFASVASSGGSLLLIPVSADCTEADVEFELLLWKGLND